MMPFQNPHIQLDMHHRYAAELRREAAADRLARAFRRARPPRRTPLPSGRARPVTP